MTKKKLKEIVNWSWFIFSRLVVAVFIVVFIAMGLPAIIKFFANLFQPSAMPKYYQESTALDSARKGIQGSFTELFSGTGWMNSEKTNVYQDTNITAISFPPDYDWKEIPVLSEFLKSKSIITVASNTTEVTNLTNKGEIFVFKKESGFLPSIFLNSGGVIDFRDARLEYDKESGRWIAVLISENNIRIETFMVASNSILRVQSFSFVLSSLKFPISKNPFDLVCLNKQCVLDVSGTLYKFSVENVSDCAQINLPKDKFGENMTTVSIGRFEDFWLIGKVEKIGGYKSSIYKYPGFDELSGGLFSSDYPGEIYFGFDEKNSEVLAVYNAYIGKALKFKISDNKIIATADYSDFFGQRVMDGVLSLKVFKYGNGWWLSSRTKSGQSVSDLKIIRIEGAVIDLTQDLKTKINEDCRNLELVPGLGENILYTVGNCNGSGIIYRFTDKGYLIPFNKGDTGDLTPLTWESLKINGNSDKKITSARFYKIIGNNTGIIYYLSNDGGKNWGKSDGDNFVDFKTEGNDLRFKAEFSPGENKFSTSWLKLIGVEYYMQ